MTFHRRWARRLSSLAWPIVALASVAWSLFLLQAKLEAEVSSDPVVKAMLDDGGLFSDMKVISQTILDQLAQIPLEGYLFSLLAAAVAYGALAWYDRIALTHLGRLKGISWAYAGVSSFVAYALAHNIGASVLSGGAVRLRAYTAKGLTKTEVALLVGMCSFTFGYGTVLLLGVVLLAEPQLLRPLADLLPAAALPDPAVRAIGALLIGLCSLYVAGSTLGLKPLRLGKVQLAYPRLGVVGQQMIAAPLEIMAAASIIYFALPQTGNPGYLFVLGAFVMSFSIGLLSQVPGGVGVMEAVFLTVMPELPATSLVAALLVWRLLYLLIPLALSGPIILAFEHRQLLRAHRGA